MTYWLASIAEHNWNVIRETKIYATGKNMKHKMRKGDHIIIYIPQKASKKFGGCIVGILKLLTDIYKDKEPLFPLEKEHGKVLYPFRAKVEIISEGKISVKDVVHSLSFVQNKKKYMLYFRGNPANLCRPLPENDVSLIINKLTQQQ